MAGTALVHIEAQRRLDDPVAETRWLHDETEHKGLPTAISAFADFTRPDAEKTLIAHLAHSQARGIRHIVTNSGGLSGLRLEDTLHVRPDWLRQLSLLEKHGRVFET